jgi:hypothetical protein
MVSRGSLRRVRRVVRILGVLAVLGFTPGWVSGTPTSAPVTLAVHEGNAPGEFGGPGGGGEP